MFGYDSYGRKIGDGGYSRVTEDGMPYADDGLGKGNLDKYRTSEPKRKERSFGNLVGMLIIFCLFVYGFPVAPTEIKWIMGIIICFWFRRLIVRIIKGFWKWLS